MSRGPLVSVIIPIHNGEAWIDECFESIIKQDILESDKLEISVYNDASTDNTREILMEWEKRVSNIPNLSLLVKHGTDDNPGGVGFAKNRAIEQSSGKYLCFQDIDDVMLHGRITAQLKEAKNFPDAIIGCQVKRVPEGSTPRLTDWANNLPQHLLTVQIYTSHGPTVLMPTWFFSRTVFEKAGLFSESGKGTPEDLLFFYSHLESGGSVRRVEEVLVIYRYHPNCTTFSVTE
ncbi:hypothetical protein RUM44_008579 [Polyplax serrata]|uniref:Glycosyltransferase 2-like domain-containing protein n=1 Tax=Polyplax serrata TaxID=468196 RepID=A0ABR1B8N5_POLSC